MTAPAVDVAAITTVAGNTPDTPDTLARRLRAHLQACATQRSPITYHDAAKALRLSPPHTIHQVTQALEQLMAQDAAADRPFIAAMVIGKSRGGLPAPSQMQATNHVRRSFGSRSEFGPIRALA